MFCSLSTLLDRERQQRHYAGAFDGGCQRPLVEGAVTGDSPGDNLAAFGYEVSEQLYILVVHGDVFVGAKPANLSALEMSFWPAHDFSS
jgi:hypothetical protein